jgi:hypothetical protein
MSRRQVWKTSAYHGISVTERVVLPPDIRGLHHEQDDENY